MKIKSKVNERDEIKHINTVIKMIKESIHIINKHDKRYLGISIGLTVISGVLPAAQIIVLQNILNKLQSVKGSFMQIFQFIILYIGINVLSYCIQEIYNCYNANFSLSFNKFVNLKMLNKATKLQLKDFENTETYNIINRAQNQGSSSILNYLKSVFNIIKQIVTIGSISLILLNFHWSIIIFILIIPVTKYYYTVNFDKKWYEIRIERTGKERQSWYINFLLMKGNAFKEIRILGLGKYFVSKYNKIQSQIINEDIILNKKITSIYIILGVFDYIITGVIFLYTVYQGYIKSIMIGDVMAYSESIYDIQTSIEEIFAQMSQIMQQSLYVELIFQFLNLEVKKDNENIKIDKINKIELRNVSYMYNNNYVVRDINILIEPETTIALIGENGSGKTTLIKIILGFYDDYEGEILINDINLRKINKNSYIEKIGCVFQDYIKYETTLRENVGLGQIDKIHDDNKIWSAIESVGLNQKIYKESKLDTIIGSWFGNKEISTGEWQRIAISRALIRDADLYILDEADSSIDIIKQKELINIYKDTLKQKLGIVISHKIDHIHLLANKIYVLEDGKIIENGSHCELMKKDKFYKRLYVQCKKI